jgi:hypothetical protein
MSVPYETKVAWEETLKDVAQMYRNAYIEDAKWQCAMPDKDCNKVQKELRFSLLKIHYMPMLATLDMIETHFSKTIRDSQQCVYRLCSRCWYRDEDTRLGTVSQFKYKANLFFQSHGR